MLAAQSTNSSETPFATRLVELETREQELAAHCAAVDAREQELQARQAGLETREDELASHLTEIELRAARLEAEKNATRAAFESLREERREFLEERLRWMTASRRP